MSPDEENRGWISGLSATGPVRQATCDRLYRYLLRVARAEPYRRAAGLGLHGPELEDLTHQAAADALLTITTKLPTFRGDSRFTTWAYTFVVFDLTAKINRHFWRRSRIPYDTEAWARLPERSAIGPDVEAEAQDLMNAVRRNVDGALTPKQRLVFIAVIFDETPIETLADQINSTQNAIYKLMFDARRKLRRALIADGYLPELRTV